MTTEPPFDPIVEAARQWDVHELGESLAMSVATSLIRAHQVVSSTLDAALKPVDLTFARYEILTLLSFSRTGALPVSKVGDRLMIHPTGVTKLCDKLEQRGVLTRETNPEDRRGVLVRITDEGRALSREASKLVAEVRFGVDLDDASLEQLFDLLRRVRHYEPPAD